MVDGLNLVHCVCVCVCVHAHHPQTSFFFGYMAVASFACFLMLGAVGFFSSLKFVRYIYSRIKVE